MDRKKRKGGVNDANLRRSLRIVQKAKQPFKILELPPEIIVNIVSKLPVKSIIRCMHISKDFRNIISDPSFSHACRANESNYFSTLYVNRLKNVFSLDLVEREKTDIWDVKGNHKIGNFSIFNLDRLTGGSCRLTGGRCNDSDRFTIYGYCNGLFCALKFNGLFCGLKFESGSYDLFVINPILDEFIQLPKPVDVQCRRMISFAYGIGYCQLTNRYKVLMIITDYIGGGNYKNASEIFTIGSDQNWRSVSDVTVPYNIIRWFKHRNLVTPHTNQSPMIPFRSALHWVVQPVDLSEVIKIEPNWGGKNYICAFDMTEETVRALPVPPEVIGHRIFSTSLSVLFDKLCMWQIRNRDDVEVWVMDEYGVEASWAKQFVLRRAKKIEYTATTVKINRIYNHPREPFTLALLAVSPEGLIFARLHDELVLYDMKKETWLMVGGQGKKKHSYLSPFVPCFVSLRNLVHG